MARGVALYLVGSVALVSLAACGRSWFEERAPWRHDAEVACMKSGSVKEGPGVAQIRPIEGPGMCGADFPLKVSLLGDSSAIGFADDPRPPGQIPNYSGAPTYSRAPVAEPLPAPTQQPYQPYPAQTYPSQNYPAQNYPPPYSQAAQPGAPLSITPHADGPYGADDTEPDGNPAYTGYPERAPYQTPSAPPAGYPAAPQPDENTPFGSPRLSVGGTASVTPAATLACPLVSALDTWMATGIQPAAQRWFGQPVVEIKQISAYSCRSMNGQRGAPISEHAFGNALDIASFTFADGRHVTVQHGWHGTPEERAFLHDVHASACRMFSTVLAPGSNAFHYNHIHVDLARRSSGRAICNPAPIPGDAIARRDPFVTGSTGSTAPIARRAAARRPVPSDDRYLPNAVPGAD